MQRALEMLEQDALSRIMLLMAHETLGKQVREMQAAPGLRKKFNGFRHRRADIEHRQTGADIKLLE
jgi:hypothetical protein